MRDHLCGVAAIALALIVTACGGADVVDRGATPGTLFVTTGSGTAEDTSELEGSTVSGTIHIVVEVSGNVSEVRFHLDGAATPFTVATVAPFEAFLDTADLADGRHVVSARVPSGKSGSTREIATAEFTVSNADPTPVPEDPEAPLDPPEDPPVPVDPPPVPEDPEAPLDPPEDPPVPVDPPTEPRDPLEADFFVAPWGSDAGVGSWEDPFASLRPVAEVARPGDVVWLRGGVYDDSSQVYYSVSMSGEEGSPITLASYPGEMAVFDGHRHPWHPRHEGDGRSVNDPMLLRVFGDHLVFEDLTFRNGVGNGFYFVGYHNVVRRVVSHDHHGHGVQFQGSFNLLEYVTSYGNDSVENGGNSANGISLTDGKHIRAIKGNDAETRGNVIRYALLYRNSDDGIGVWNSWETLIEYSVSFENGIGPTGNGTGFKLGGEHRMDIGTVARFNIAFANRVNFNTNTSTGVTLVHNTSWAVRDGGIGFALTTHATGADANFAYNNISFKDRWPRARGDGTDDRNNSWNLGINDPSLRSLDLASPDFLALRSDSPAINVGRNVGLPYTGNGPDLGALQLGDRVTLTRAPDGSWRLKAWEVATP